MIGIIGAMESEVAQLVAMMGDAKITKKAGMTFYEGRLCGKDTVVVQSGIGKVNAALCTQVLADVFAPSAIINTGIAGSLCADINIGDVVLSTGAIQHDFDLRVFGYDMGQVPGMDKIFAADGKLSSLAEAACKKANPEIGVFKGLVVSGDQFIMSRDKKNQLAGDFAGALCTEMEGAAIAQGCVRNEIPFLIIRAISDKADDSANMTMDEFEPLAIRHAVNLLTELLSHME